MNNKDSLSIAEPVIDKPIDAASEINRLHFENIEAARTTIQRAMRIGELLSQMKSKLRHGEWLPWLEANVAFDARTAQRYVKVYENRDRLKNDSVSYLKDAYRILVDNEERCLEGTEHSERVFQIFDKVGTGEISQQMADEHMSRLCPITSEEAEQLTKKISDGLEKLELGLILMGMHLAKARANKIIQRFRTFPKFCEYLRLSPEVANIAIDLYELIAVSDGDADFVVTEGTKIRMRLIHLISACEDEDSLLRAWRGSVAN
jgi:hypothetical protein